MLKVRYQPLSWFSLWLSESYNLDANSWGEQTTQWSKRSLHTRRASSVAPWAALSFAISSSSSWTIRGFATIRGDRVQPAFFPTDATGNFSALLAPENGAIQLYDTQNNFAPYANNQVPIVNPVASFSSLTPTLSTAQPGPSSGLLENNYLAPQKTIRFNIRVILDHMGPECCRQILRRFTVSPPPVTIKPR